MSKIVWCVYCLFFLLAPWKDQLEYQVLKIERMDKQTDPFSRVYCAVNLSKSVNVEVLKRLICTVVRKEKLEKYRAIGISVHYGITQLRHVPLDPSIVTNVDNLVGFYIIDLRMSPTGWLYVELDENGNPIKGGRLRIEFTHLKDCR